MNQKIKDYITEANKIISNYQESIAPTKIDKELKSYISSLGASILMAGLIPTLAVYAADETNSKAARYIILDWINKLINNTTESDSLKNAKALFNSTLELNDTQRTKLEKQILDASIAFKLCIRTFELSK